MIFFSVELQNGHVRGSADHEEDEKDGAYWDINADCRDTAEGRVGTWVGSMKIGCGHGGSLRRGVVS